MNVTKIVLPLSLALCSTAVAQFNGMTTSTVARDASYVRTVGETDLNARIDLRGSASATTTRMGVLPVSGTVRVDGSATGRVRVFTVTREAARITGFGQVGASLMTNTGNFSAGFAVRLAGQTVYSPSYSGSYTFNPSFNRTFGSPTILTATKSVPTPVGIPINLAVSAGATAQLRLGARLVPTQARAELNGSATAVATGRATVSINALCASVGLSTTLRLMNSRLTAGFVANANGTVGGSLSYRLEAARLLVRFFMNICGFSGNLDVFDFSSPVYSGSRTLN